MSHDDDNDGDNDDDDDGNVKINGNSILNVFLVSLEMYLFLRIMSQRNHILCFAVI